MFSNQRTSVVRSIVRHGLVAALLLSAARLLAQPGESSIITRTLGSESGQIQASQPLSASQSLPPVERSIDPARYRVGPNDILLINFQNPAFATPGPYQSVITLDNTLPLPNGPLLNTKGMTLARLRRAVDSVYRATRGNYSNLSVSLFQPRVIYITVRGDVINPSRFKVTAADRVTTAIDIANLPPDGINSRDLALARRAAGQDRPPQQISAGGAGVGLGQLPLRFVTIRHNDGTTTEADLVRYEATGDESYNPTLLEGDIITVRRSSFDNPTVVVAGAVDQVAVIPYRNGDDARMLIGYAGGASADADLAGAYISRSSAGGQDSIPVRLSDTTALKSLQLRAGDRLIIPRIPVDRASRAGVVSVSGEVNRPGDFPIISGVTKLSEIVTGIGTIGAGGLTPYASLNGSYIERKVPGGNQNALAAATDDPAAGLATSSLFLEDTTRFKADRELQQSRVSADFVAVFERRDAGKDVVLQSGDRIVIPRTPGNVMVSGRVKNPGWIAYVPGAPFDFYIEAAGGFTEAADEGRTTVAKFNSTVWLAPDETTIAAGDNIYVPGDRDTPARTSLEVANTITGITGAVISLTLQVITFIQQQNAR